MDTGRVRTHLLAGAPAAHKAVHAVRGELNDEALGQLIGLMDDETDSAGAISEALGNGYVGPPETGSGPRRSP